ncbi:MAG: OmpA family protein [Ignavibacteria bacterium]|jgi:outer membrane protein OmpA-like peptidoglycan-associated protein/Mg-chelatase subunit ChlD
MMIEKASNDKQKKAVSLRYSAFSFLLVMALGTILFSSCGTSRRAASLSSLELQSDVSDSMKRQFLLTSTKHIDSAKPSDIRMEISRIETKSYPQEIRLFAKVFDTTGHYITHIAPPYRKDQQYWYLLKEKLGRSNVTIDSFRVREYGDADSIPYAIMLSVDFSGSMTGVMDAISMGTELFVNMKQPQDRIGISTFTKDYTLKVPMWKDKDIIVNTFKSTFLDGQGYYSGLYDAIMKSMEAFTSEIPDTVPKVIVVFSDGEDNYSKTRLKMILDTAKTKGVNIFTVGFGYPNDEIMRQIAQYTGGKYYRAKTKEELIAIFLDIYRSLRNFYKISYKAPEYYGIHTVKMGLDFSSDTILCDGEYDTAPLGPGFDVSDGFKYPIQFDFNSSIVREESMIRIDELAELMQRYPKLRLEIQGHTDNIGGEEFNQRLSDARAKSVMQEMIKRGIEEKRLRARGFGMSQPVAPNDSERNRALNRRTQFIVLAK